MTYARDFKVEAADFNDRVANVNAVWSTGSGSTGYGQAQIPTASVGNIVTAGPSVSPVEWARLIKSVNSMYAWQQSTATPITQPTSGNIIAFLSNLDSAITNIGANRFNSPPLSMTPFASGSGIHIAPWGGGTTAQLTSVATVTFPTSETARYFFNTGGQITYALTYFQPPPFNPITDQWAAMIGSGLRYTLTPQIFWAGTATTIITATGSGPYGGESVRVNVSGLGSQVVTFTTVLLDNYNNPFVQDAILGSFTVTITALHAPADTNLTVASWTPAPTISVPNF